MATIIEMPKLSDTMTVGTLVNWLKQEGDTVASGDKIAEVETDKATMEMEVFDEGVLLKQFVSTGEEVAVGEPICAVGEKGEKVDAPEKKKPEPKKEEKPKEEDKKDDEKEKEKDKEPEDAPEEKSETPTEEAEDKSAAPAKSAAAPPRTTAGGERLKISPLARKLATDKGVELATVRGTGPGGRIVRADVEAAAKAPKAAGAPTTGAPGGAPFVGTSDQPVQEDKVVKVSNMRGAIAKRLVESKTQLPHFYLEVEIDAGPLVALREQVKESLGDAGRISVNDMILKACAHALRRVPAVNCSFQGETIKHHAAAHVSFAVAIDDGLITPVVFNAHAKTVFQIGKETRELAGRAKNRKLKPEEYTGGTFCVSNLGMMGVRRFTAIINPPNAAILAIGTTVKTPVVHDGQIVVGHRMSLTMSCDHRVVDGAIGAEFLTALREILEKPVQILF